ncbi:flagellar basal body L-ring protein FlgH [soil metagenome]
MSHHEFEIMPFSPVAAALLALAVLSMSACSTVERPRVDISGPTTVRPAPAPLTPPENGAIFQVGMPGNRPLFEDRRARYVGDTLTITINEKTQAQSNQSTNANRSSSLTATQPGLKGLGPISFNPLDFTVSSDTKFDGKGATAADNNFAGTITVTVNEVLSNGNLVVAGEKQVGIGQNLEKLRFSGVVNPAYILNGNVISSTQIADARLETHGQGAIDQAQTVGWLNRFFMSYWPF